MGLLTRLEQSLTHNLGAAALAGALFSSSLREAGAQNIENPLPESAATIRSSEAQSAKNATTIKPVGITRGDNELAKIWLPEQKVYVDRAVLDKGINIEVFEKLSSTLKDQFPNWTIYVSTPKESNSNDKKPLNTSLIERSDSIAKEITTLARYSNTAEVTNSETAPMFLMICYGQSDLPTVASTITPNKIAANHALNQWYWNEHFAPQLAKALSSKGDFDSAVRSTIADFEDSLAQRVAATESEAAVQHKLAEAKIVKTEESVTATLSALSESMGKEIPEFIPEHLAVQKEFFDREFKEVRQLLEARDLRSADATLTNINSHLAKISLFKSHDVAEALKEIDSLGSYIKEVRQYHFIDEPTVQACNELESGLKKTKLEILSLNLDPKFVIAEISRSRSSLDGCVDNDRTPEILGCVAASIIGIIGTCIVAPTVIDQVGTFVDKKKRSYAELKSNREEESRQKQSELSNISTIERSLAEKEQALKNFSYAEPLEEIADLEDVTSPAVKAWFVLRKMKELVAEAKQQVTRAKSSDLPTIAALLKDGRVPVSKSDSLAFLPSYAAWKKEMLLADPHHYRDPTVSFNELSAALNALLAQTVDEYDSNKITS